jgi:ubiquinone/menaquinone biosynthesis C-methylase UbiE
LDLGCGTGSISLYMACKLQDRGKVAGIDIKKDRISCARQRKNVLENETGCKINCEFYEANVLSLPADIKFDLIYLEETFHHLEPRTEIVNKISKLLADNGVLIISEVNAYNPLMQFHLFLKRGFKTIKKKVGEDGKEYLYGNERIVPASVLSKLFVKNNLHVRSIRYLRIFSSRFAKLIDDKDIDLISIEKRLSNISFLQPIISVHYNIMFDRGIHN